MILIVEGIDRVGKSTLVEKLKKMVGFYPYHNDTNFKVDIMDNDNETDKLLKMLLICDASDPLIVFDRFHWTDYVYGTLERGYNNYKAVSNLKLLESELKKRDARIIFVVPTDIESSSKQHGKDLSIHQEVFEALFNLTKLKKCCCDYNGIDHAVEWARRELNEYIKESGC